MRFDTNGSPAYVVDKHGERELRPERPSSLRKIAEEVVAKWPTYANPIDAIEDILRDERERAAKIADGVEEEWLTSARNVVRANDLVGGLAQSTYTSYAEVAGKIATAIRNGVEP